MLLFLPRLVVDVVTSSAPLASLAITSGSVCSGVASRRLLLGRGGGFAGLGGGEPRRLAFAGGARSGGSAVVLSDWLWLEVLPAVAFLPFFYLALVVFL